MLSLAIRLFQHQPLGPSVLERERRLGPKFVGFHEGLQTTKISEIKPLWLHHLNIQFGEKESTFLFLEDAATTWDLSPSLNLPSGSESLFRIENVRTGSPETLEFLVWMDFFRPPSAADQLLYLKFKITEGAELIPDTLSIAFRVQ